MIRVHGFTGPFANHNEIFGTDDEVLECIGEILLHSPFL